MKSVLTFVFLLIVLSCGSSRMSSVKENCQTEYDNLIDGFVYTKVDRMPEYPEGQIGILKFIRQNFKYPQEEFFQGSFQIEFIVNIDGSVIGQRIRLQKIRDLSKLEVELLNIIGKMSWEPGECAGVKVPVRMYIPLNL